VSGAGVGGHAAIVAFIRTRGRRARSASFTGRGGCRGGGPTRASTTRSNSWWVTAVANVAFVLPPGLSGRAQREQMLIGDGTPTRLRESVWSASRAACAAGLGVANGRRRGRNRGLPGYRRRNTGPSHNTRHPRGQRTPRVFFCPRSSSAGAVTPTGGGLPVVRFAPRRRRRGLRAARFPPGVWGSRGPQRPRRGGAPPLAGGGGGGNDGVLPPARRWGAAAPLQNLWSSAAAPTDQARPNRWPSCRRRATRVFVCPRHRRRAR